MNDATATVFAAAVTALGVVGAAFVAQALIGRNQKPKTNSDALSVLLDVVSKSGKTMSELMSMIAELPAMKQKLETALLDLDEIKKEHEEWRVGIGILLSQMVKARIRPNWTPRGVSAQVNDAGSSGGLMR